MNMIIFIYFHHSIYLLISFLGIKNNFCRYSSFYLFMYFWLISFILAPIWSSAAILCMFFNYRLYLVYELFVRGSILWNSQFISMKIFYHIRKCFIPWIEISLVIGLSNMLLTLSIVFMVLVQSLVFRIRGLSFTIPQIIKITQNKF